MIRISHCYAFDEMNAVVEFIRWQTINHNFKFKILSDSSILKETSGPSAVKIEIGDDVIWGFKNLIKYWEEKGLWLC